MTVDIAVGDSHRATVSSKIRLRSAALVSVEGKRWRDVRTAVPSVRSSKRGQMRRRARSTALALLAPAAMHLAAIGAGAGAAFADPDWAPKVSAVYKLNLA